VLRSKNIYGPYEDKIVLAQGRSPINGPHQGALVDTADGEWWFVHFQESQPYGRIVHLQPVNWKDDWPLMGVDGEPVLQHRKPKVREPQAIAVPAASDEFEGKALGLQWQWHANHRGDEWYSLSAKPSSLRLFARPLPGDDLASAPHLLLQKLPAREFSVETRVEAMPVVTAGIVLMGKKHAALVLKKNRVVLRIDNVDATSAVLDHHVARLKMIIDDGGKCTFAHAGDFGNFLPIGTPFQAVEGVWIGAKVGLFATTPTGVDAHADFEYFRFGKPG
jgi:beta-xylosidase